MPIKGVLPCSLNPSILVAFFTHGHSDSAQAAAVTHTPKQ